MYEKFHKELTAIEAQMSALHERILKEAETGAGGDKAVLAGSYLEDALCAMEDAVANMGMAAGRADQAQAERLQSDFAQHNYARAL